MFLIFAKLLVGLMILFWSADRLVSASSAMAKHLGIPPLVIGLTIVGFGTSAPEIVVSFIASFQNNSEIAIGNAIGSNITNIGFVLGVCALCIPLQLKRTTIQQEIPIMVGISLFVSLWLWILGLNEVTGVMLSLLLVGYFAWLFYKTQRQPFSEDNLLLSEEFAKEIPKHMPIKTAVYWLAFSFLALPFSSKLLVDGAVQLAIIFGVSELVIGLTLIAFGTSLPELAASLVSVFRREHNIAVGNIIGSNIFNLTAVLLPPCFITPNRMPDPFLFSRDLPAMLGFTFLFMFISRRKKTFRRISRFEGGILLSLYVCYMAFLALTM